MEDKKEMINEDVLLMEYQTAQDSAQHHDNLIWTVTSILWGGTLVLFGFVLGALDKYHLRIILTFLSILGMVLIITVWGFAFQLNSVKRQKYNRCKTIEKLLNMHQHRDLKYLIGSQRIVYSMISIFFIIAWLIVLCIVWKN